MKLCECGCGREVKNRFIRGHTSGKVIEKQKKTWETKIANGYVFHNTGKRFAKYIKIKCSYCGKERYVQPYRKNIKFCNSICYHKNDISQKTRDKISKANTKPKTQIVCFICGGETTNNRKTCSNKCLHIFRSKYNAAKNPEVGKKITRMLMGHITLPETRKKQSARKQGIDVKDWKKFVSREPYGQEFNDELKEQIRKRDYYSCQYCFKRQIELRDKNNKKYKLHVHHIDYNKKNCNPNNLISLCRNHHIPTNRNREYWTEYFNWWLNNIS